MSAQWIAENVKLRHISELKPYANNARIHPKEQIEKLKASMLEFGITQPCLHTENDDIIAGHGRLIAAQELVDEGYSQYEYYPCYCATGWSEAQIKAYVILDNKIAEGAQWNEDLLNFEFGQLTAMDFDMSLLEFDPEAFGQNEAEQEQQAADVEKNMGALAEQFGVPPFSVLNARDGWWQNRKRVWLGLGIKSELGRGDNLIKRSPQEMLSLIIKGPYQNAVNYLEDARARGLTDEQAIEEAKQKHKKKNRLGKCLETGIGEKYGKKEMNGTSIFDPVLCELSYRWFSPDSGTIIDPFAGGSVRGIVAAKLGRPYVGVDLRAEQVEANQMQWEEMGDKESPAPVWVNGDSLDIGKLVEGEFDMIFSCPPYADLEVYSDDPKDLSTMSYPDFKETYFAIIKEAVAKLKQDRFAVFVVGEVRQKGNGGAYYGFVPDTIAAFEAAGANYYNEAILVTMVGSLPIKARKQFLSGRKLGKTHQNILVFCKGDPVAAAQACGVPQFGEIDEQYIDPEIADDGENEDDYSLADNFAPKPVRLDYTPDLTPIEQYGNNWAKRDDLWSLNGAVGGKARTCWALAQGAAGLTTAGSRSSPQVNIVAHVAQKLGVPFRAHCPKGEISPELKEAELCGAEIIQHKAGYNNVIIARSREDAKSRGWVDIPFGMECEEAVKQNRAQVKDLPAAAQRIVIPVGSGMSLSGLLWGLKDAGLNIPVLGVVVGADPKKRLDKFAPPDWADMVELVASGSDYHHPEKVVWNGIQLDPHYEAKAAKFLQDGDILWIIGVRASL